jgi:hypothetical protein
LGEEIGKILSKPFGFRMPTKYRPMHAITVATKIYSVLKNPLKGIDVYEGSQIYEIDENLINPEK